VILVHVRYRTSKSTTCLSSPFLRIFFIIAIDPRYYLMIPFTGQIPAGYCILFFQASACHSRPYLYLFVVNTVVIYMGGRSGCAVSSFLPAAGGLLCPPLYLRVPWSMVGSACSGLEGVRLCGAFLRTCNAMRSVAIGTLQLYGCRRALLILYPHG
jgi:hypothetical protein